MNRVGFASTNEPEAVFHKIQLELGEANKEGDEWSLAATAIVSDRDSRPVMDIAVQFYRNSARVDEPVETEGDGRATKEFSGLTKGNHFFEAQIVGTDRRAKQKLNLKEDAKTKTPKKLKVDVSGWFGQYDLMISVMTEEGASIKKAPIAIMDPQATPSYKEQKTNDGGGYHHRLDFTEKERHITIAVPGTELSWKRLLPGPRK